MDTANASGSFLVRESKSSPGSYSLSIRDAQKVSHHRIQKLDGGGYFITPQFTFASIPELVAHYSKQSDGLLKSPCVIKKPQTDGLSTFKDALPTKDKQNGNKLSTKSQELNYLHLVGKHDYSSRTDYDEPPSRPLPNPVGPPPPPEGYIPNNYVAEYKSLDAEE